MSFQWEQIDEREKRNKDEQKALKEYLKNQNEDTKRRKQLVKQHEIEEYRKITQAEAKVY